MCAPWPCRDVHPAGACLPLSCTSACGYLRCRLDAVTSCFLPPYCHPTPHESYTQLVLLPLFTTPVLPTMCMHHLFAVLLLCTPMQLPPLRAGRCDLPRLLLLPPRAAGRPRLPALHARVDGLPRGRTHTWHPGLLHPPHTLLPAAAHGAAIAAAAGRTAAAAGAGVPVATVRAAAGGEGCGE